MLWSTTPSVAQGADYPEGSRHPGPTIRHRLRDGIDAGIATRSTCPERQGDRTRLDGHLELAGSSTATRPRYMIHDTRSQRNATATPTAPTVPELPPTSPSGGVFGIYSSIVDESSLRQLAGRPAVLPDSYGPLRAAGRGSTAPGRQSTPAPAHIRVADGN
jgi:hypothetical protein